MSFTGIILAMFLTMASVTLAAGAEAGAQTAADAGSPALSPAAGSTTGPGRWNVREMGAKGDGAADDTAPIQEALDRASAQGGAVFIPAGQYRITKTLHVTGGSAWQRGAKPEEQVPGNWVEIRGEGQTSRLMGDGVEYILATKEEMTEKGTRRNFNGLHVDAVTFVSADATKGKRCGGIDASYMLRWSCTNSFFFNLTQGIHTFRGREKEKSVSTWIIRLTDNQFHHTSDFAISLGRVFDLVIDNNVIDQCAGGISVGEPGDGFNAAANTIRITSNMIEGCTRLPAILGSCWVGAKVSGNYFEANAKGDIIIAPTEKDGGSRGVLIQANSFGILPVQRNDPKYGPILIKKMAQAQIIGNFSTGRLLHADSTLGSGVNIASNVSNVPAEITTEAGAAVTPDGDDPVPSARDIPQRWQVVGPTTTVGIHGVQGFTFQPRGQRQRSISYAAQAPTTGEHQPGDLVLSLAPSLSEGKLLLGWVCITAGRPGVWKALHCAVE